MATIRWIGGVSAIAQVDTLTPGGTIEIGDLFNVTLTDERGESYTLSVAATGTTVAQVCQDLITAIAACNDPRFTRITAAGVGSVGSYTAVTLTADTAGEPFSCTVATTESGGGAADGQTFSRAATTASAGPYDANCAGNWLGGVKPVTGDTVYVETGKILYGMNQSAVQLAVLVVRGYETEVGQNPPAGLLPAYLRIGATLAQIGENVGPGADQAPALVMLDVGSGTSAITVYNSGYNSDSFLPSVWLKAANSSTTITVRKGIVGIGYGDGESGVTVNRVDVLYTAQKLTDATVIVGSAVTFDGSSPVLNQKGGKVTLRTGVATVNSDDGTLITEGSGAIAALTIKRAMVVSNSTGTVTAASVEGSGVLDTTKSDTPRTIGTVHLHVGATFKRNTALTVTNPITFDEPVSISVQAA